MSRKSELKIIVSRDEVDMVVKRASLAAMTEEGQSEIAKASNETRGCIRIVAKDGVVTFDSGVSRFSARHVIKASDGKAVIESEGEACVPAKEFREVVAKIPSQCRVVMSYANQPAVVDSASSDSMRSILPDGVLAVGAMRKEKVVAQARIESYPTAQFSEVAYPELAALRTVISGNVEAIKKPWDTVSFAINPKDINEVVNKLAIFDGGDSVYFVATDTRRCAIVKAEKSTFAQSSDFAVEENGKQVPVMIDAEYLTPIIGAATGDDVVTVAVDGEGEYLYMFCGNSAYRVSRLDKTMAMKFPDYRRMLNMPIGTVLSVDREECQIALDVISPANNDRAKYLFVKEAVKVTGRGLAAIKNAEGELAYSIVSGDPLKSDNICLHTAYFRQAVKQMRAENLRVSFSKDELKVRIEDATDPQFVYFMQVMNPNEAA